MEVERRRRSRAVHWQEVCGVRALLGGGVLRLGEEEKGVMDTPKNEFFNFKEVEE